MNWRAGLLVGSLGLAALLPAGCGSGNDGGSNPPSNQKNGQQTPDGGQPDAGEPDGGHTDGGVTDGGHTDGGPADGGTDGGIDGGTDGGTDGGITDGGTDGGTQLPEPPPSTVTELSPAGGFQLFSIKHDDGSPVTVNGITADEGGNIWVAAGTDGLFLKRNGSSTWEQFTLKDGLHPYGFDKDGNDLPGPYYLEVLSVSGGPSGTVFVGYRGRPVPGFKPDDDTCENNWDTTDPTRDPKDPSIYQSGDADRVTLNGAGGINVVHYDIFSGPNVVAREPEGRERLCSVYRVLYDGPTHSVWFGANHGVAWGDASYPGMKALGCVGSEWGKMWKSNGQSCEVWEHFHPLLGDTQGNVRTFRYYGLAQGTNGLWVGGWDRSVHYDFGNRAANFWTYEGNQNDPDWWLDVWPDQVRNYVDDTTEKVDAVTSVAAMPDGSAWMGSWHNGAARLNSSGTVVQYLTTHGGLLDDNVTATATDPNGSGVWFGYNYGGVSHYDGSFQHFSWDVFGADQIAHRVADLYSDRVNHRLLMAFDNGVVGIRAE